MRTSAVAEHETTAPDDVDVGDLVDVEEVVQLEVQGLERMVRRGGEVSGMPLLRVDDPRRQVAVVEQRRVGGEALLPHQLLEGELTGLETMLGVPLGGHEPAGHVVRDDELLGGVTSVR